MIRDVIFNPDARKKMREGVNVLADAVQSTLGPSGCNVTIQHLTKSPNFTKDGVSVAREINLEDSLMDQGVQLVKQAAEKTMEEAGDGTTTSIVLSRALYSEGLTAVEESVVNPIRLSTGIDMACDEVCKFITDSSQEVSSKEDLIKVASIAANNDQSLGKLIGSTMHKIGADGVIIVQEGMGEDDTVEYIDGYQLDSGMIHFHIFNRGKSEAAEVKDPIIIAAHAPIQSEKVISEMLKLARDEQRPLIVISEAFSDLVLQKMLRAQQESGIMSYPIKAQDVNEHRQAVLEDTCIVTGCEFLGHLGMDLTKVKGTNDVKEGEGSWVGWHGSCSKAIISATTAKLIFEKPDEARKEAIANRIKQVQIKLDNARSSNNSYVADKCQKRIARLSGGIASLRIVARTESDMLQKKARVEDALYATKSAVEKGIQPGGGTALLRASKYLQSKIDNYGVLHTDSLKGMQIVQQALSQPFKIIFENAGIDKIDDYITRVLENPEYWHGFDLNAEAGNVDLADLRDAGVVDTTKVILAVVKNASNVAKMLLTTNVVIVNTEKQDDRVMQELMKRR